MWAVVDNERLICILKLAIRTKTCLLEVMYWVSLEVLVVYPVAEHCQMAAAGHHWRDVDPQYLKVVSLNRLVAVDDLYIGEVTRRCPLPRLELPPPRQCEG